MTDAKLSAALAALEAMPARTRTVFVLHRFEDWPYSRIAGHLGISKRAVERHMCKAMAAVHEALSL